MSAISAKALVDLGWSEIVAELARRAHTCRGEQRAAALEFASNIDEARRRLNAISEARELTATGNRLSFAGISDVGKALARAAKFGVLDQKELFDVAQTGAAVARLAKRAQELAKPELARVAGALPDLVSMYRPILDVFNDAGTFADHASEALGKLRRQVRKLRDQLESRVNAMVAEHAAHLQDQYFTQRGDRYVVPVKASSRSRVPGIVHGTSQSGQTIFVEPSAVVDLGNRLRLAECAVSDEEWRIQEQLSRIVAICAVELDEAIDVIAEIDVFVTAGAVADNLRAAAPTLLERGGVRLLQARHPLMLLAGKSCVANDIVIEEGKALIISGPNAGGKTVALKTLGLASLMARAGLHVVAASGSELPWFENIFTDIGDAQSLERDLSTFSGHMDNLRNLLEHADRQTLVLIDEIAVGTEPEQGAALALAVLERLASRAVPAVVTTHYDRLKEAAVADERFANASVGFDLEALAPTFELHLGVPGSSGALDVARRMGIEPEVLSRARELLGAERSSLEDMLAEVADERQRVLDEREQLREALRVAEAERARAEDARTRAKEAERRAHDLAHSDAVRALKEARAELDRLTKVARRQKEPPKEIRKQVDDLARQVSHSAPAAETVAGIRPALSELDPGTRVFVSSLGMYGTVNGVPDKNRVEVVVGTLRSQVLVSDLVLPSAAGPVSKPKSQQSYSSASEAAGVGEREPSRTLDLRGFRVEEALDAIDAFIDRALIEGAETIFVIHGHGTGALRKAVRAHIRTHKVISKSRPGERNEGGDGVTVATLGD